MITIKESKDQDFARYATVEVNGKERASVRQSRSFRDGSWETPTVGWWSSSGNSTAADARAAATALQHAALVADRWALDVEREPCPEVK